MAYTLVLDDDGKPKFDAAGRPLFTQPGGTEFPLDLAGLYDAVRQKNGEAAANRKEKEALAAKLAAFEGLDPEQAGQALELVREKEKVIHNLLVKTAFAESDFLREKTVLPPDFAYAGLGRYFSVEYRDGGTPVVVAKDGAGNAVFSEEDPAVYASPEEAIRRLIENHPQRDALLRAPAPNGGSGAHPGGGARSGSRTLRRSEFEFLSPQDKAAKIKDGWSIVD